MEPLVEGFDREKAIRFFKRNYEALRLTSAYLFIGRAKKEKKETAIKLAQILNCRNSYLSDCHCPKCNKISSLEHPDVLWLSPEGRKRSIKIDDIRDLKRRIYLKPYELTIKVFIIDEADKMTEEAQNALLKTLEEPPLDSLIILMSVGIYGLLETIVSRCKIIKFKERKNYHYEQVKADIIDRFLSYKSEKIDDFFNVLSREEFGIYIEALMDLFRDIIIFKSSRDKTLLMNTDKYDKIKSVADFYSYEKLYKTVNFLSTMYKNLSLNLNLKTCIINTIFQFRKLTNLEMRTNV